MVLSIGKLKVGNSPLVVGVISDERDISKLSLSEVKCVDLIELRVDMFSRLPSAEYAFQKLHEVKTRFKKPVILTIRSAREGGFLHIDDQSRLEIFKSLIPLADAIDIEISSKELMKKLVPIMRKYPLKSLIASYHNFNKTPSADLLNKILLRGKKMGAGIVKVATYATNIEDVIRLAAFTLKNRDKKIVTLAMGKAGITSRIFLPLVGSLFTYGYLGAKPSAPGQIQASRIAEFFRDYFSA